MKKCIWIIAFSQLLVGSCTREKKSNSNNINESQPQIIKEKTIEIANEVTMTFCWCPQGEFMMGSSVTEKERGYDEDQVKVTFRKGFWMGKTEVTQKQWRALMGSNPSEFHGDNLPVEKVSWNEAKKFIAKLNQQLNNLDSGVIMLPTEAQWEYACRAGKTGAYSGERIDDVAWHYSNSNGKTHPVGTKKANSWGIYDMHGNVQEWCQDSYGELSRKLPGGVDPQDTSFGDNRVYRGGSWGTTEIACRAAHRLNGVSSYVQKTRGFRVACSSVQ
jgi:formylglycine-generating enzyme required for sulfatase activity